jgi:hypothetical protein
MDKAITHEPHVEGSYFRRTYQSDYTHGFNNPVGWVRFFCKAKKRNPTRMCHQMLGYVIALRLII